MSDKMREALEALRRARDKAMFQTVKTPIPLCAEFADIAQDVAHAIVALAEQPAQGEAVDKGPWRAVAEHNNPVTGVWIESDDFAHDVRLYVNGDFADQGQRLAYAKRIADCLMNDWDEGWMQGWDDCRAGTPTPNRIR